MVTPSDFLKLKIENFYLKTAKFVGIKTSFSSFTQQILRYSDIPVSYLANFPLDIDLNSIYYNNSINEQFCKR